MNSWDRTQIPKPFARVGLAIGQPIAIHDTQDTTIDRGVQQLQDTLYELERRAQQIIADSR